MILGVVTMAIILITFSPIPLWRSLPTTPSTWSFRTATRRPCWGTSVNVTRLVNNTGNTNTTMDLTSCRFRTAGASRCSCKAAMSENATDLLEVLVPYDEGVVVIMKVTVPEEEGPVWTCWSI